MNRRNFIASLFAPLVAKFGRKRRDLVPGYPQIVRVGEAFVDGGHTFYAMGWHFDMSRAPEQGYGLSFSGRGPCLGGIPFEELQRIAREYA